jgi:ligand-binding SRPBCC domain-containing protein
MFERMLAAARTRPERGVTHLHLETLVPAPLGETFRFFADAANLERITPPWLKFEIVTPMPVSMQASVEIDYRIVVHGVPLPWRSRIDVWEPGVRFVDRQVVGPYRWWRHEHRFEALGIDTRVIDDVEYVPRARFVSDALVRRDLERIFAYRHAVLWRVFDTACRA